MNLQRYAKFFESLKIVRIVIIFIWGTLFTFCLSGGIVAAQKVSGETLNQDKSKDSAVLRQQGFRYLQTADWLGANAIFEQVLAKLPNDYYSLYGNGLALFNLRRVDDAEKNVDKATALLTISRADNKFLAEVLVLSAVISAGKKKNDEAIEKLNSAVKLSPESYDTNFSLGRAYFGNGDYANAVKFFEAAVKIQPTLPQAKFFLATALERNGNLSEALEEYRSIVKLNENYADGNLGLGVLLINLEGEKSEEGLKALKKAVALNPNLYEAQIALGKALLKSSKIDEAVTHLLKASELQSENPEPLFQLSLAYRKLGKIKEAAAAAEKVRKIHGKRRAVSVN